MRAASQLLHRPADVRDPAELARRTGGIQAQDQPGWRLSFRARSRSLTAADVERARLEERSLLRTWLMRMTIHVIATDDDQLNLRTAIALRSLHPKADILVRTIYESAFSAHIAAELDFTVLPIDQLLRRALTEHQPRWLG